MVFGIFKKLILNFGGKEVKMKKTKLMVTMALVLITALALAMVVGATSDSFFTIEEAAGGRNIQRDFEFIDGGLGGGGNTESAPAMFTDLAPHEELDGKYGAGGDHELMWAEWRYPEAFVADRFFMASANDSMAHNRTVGDWGLYGSTDGSNWTRILYGGPDAMDFENHMWFYVDIPNNTAAFQYYRWEVYEMFAGFDQIARIALSGNAPEAAAPPVVEAPAQETPPAVEAPAAQPTPPAPTPTAAPQTFDPITLIAVGAIVAGAGAVVVKRRKK